MPRSSKCVHTAKIKRRAHLRLRLRLHPRQAHALGAGVGVGAVVLLTKRKGPPQIELPFSFGCSKAGAVLLSLGVPKLALMLADCAAALNVVAASAALVFRVTL